MEIDWKIVPNIFIIDENTIAWRNCSGLSENNDGLACAFEELGVCMGIDWGIMKFIGGLSSCW